MRGIPDHSPEQSPVPTSDTILVRPPALTPKAPLPEALAALGREVLDLVPRKPQPSLAAYRQAANDLSAILKVSRVRVTPKVLYYTALRVKWMQDSVLE